MHEEYIMDHFKFHSEPLPNDKAIVKGQNYRFTILTSRLIRMEYSEMGKFEDRASQTVWFRKLEVPDFKISQSDKWLIIETEHLILTYKPAQKFRKSSLSIRLKESNSIWKYGMKERKNLKGTYRTLDGTNGWVPLKKGLLSRSGFATLDDSDSLVFNEHCWLIPREESVIDMYFFGYGTKYLECIRDYYKITGKTPLIPRYILGNWWSRYWEYDEQELKDLINNFGKNDIPLSVCIIDMDWHLVKLDPKYGNGWTGYTWNRKLFPDPPAMLQWLHDKNLKVALNLHPALGIRGHEDCYPAMADFMGVNKAAEEPIPFDIADPKFVKGYFELVHHPLEKQGVDFWWIDWQQGTRTKIKNLDPLWMLNHLHFFDLGRDKTHRSFIFSRYAGRGCHRYPIGFSGDTLVTWRSLAYQPYFTTTASNIGFGWWSHDIGGHMFGREQAELYTRWVQFGVFSPIMRLHSSKMPFYKREPWKYDKGTLINAGNWMRFRHQMIPYIYSMAYQNYKNNVPLMRPMYYYAPKDANAYRFKRQYWYGSEFIVSPVVKKANKKTARILHKTYLPIEQAFYFNFFTKEYFEGGKVISLVYELDEVPVFAKAGAIVPLSDDPVTNSTHNPKIMKIEVFPGASNEFYLYEDDGSTENYKQNSYYITKFQLDWNETVKLQVELPDSKLPKPDYIPKNRTFTIYFNAIEQPSEIRIDGISSTETKQEYLDGCLKITILSTEFNKLNISFPRPNIIKKNEIKNRTFKMLMDSNLSTLKKNLIYKKCFKKSDFDEIDLKRIFNKIRLFL